MQAGRATRALLETYEPERRAADEVNVQRSLENAANHFSIGDALGVSHESWRQIGPDGALLVRPDRFIAWRSLYGSQEAAEELSVALGQILARPIGTIAATA